MTDNNPDDTSDTTGGESKATSPSTGVVVPSFRVDAEILPLRQAPPMALDPNATQITAPVGGPGGGDYSVALTPAALGYAGQVSTSQPISLSTTRQGAVAMTDDTTPGTDTTFGGGAGTSTTPAADTPPSPELKLPAADTPSPSASAAAASLLEALGNGPDAPAVPTLDTNLFPSADFSNERPGAEPVELEPIVVPLPTPSSADAAASDLLTVLGRDPVQSAAAPAGDEPEVFDIPPFPRLQNAGDSVGLDADAAQSAAAPAASPAASSEPDPFFEEVQAPTPTVAKVMETGFKQEHAEALVDLATRTQQDLDEYFPGQDHKALVRVLGYKDAVVLEKAQRAMTPWYKVKPTELTDEQKEALVRINNRTRETTGHLVDDGAFEGANRQEKVDAFYSYIKGGDTLLAAANQELVQNNREWLANVRPSPSVYAYHAATHGLAPDQVDMVFNINRIDDLKYPDQAAKRQDLLNTFGKAQWEGVNYKDLESYVKERDGAKRQDLLNAFPAGARVAAQEALQAQRAYEESIAAAFPGGPSVEAVRKAVWDHAELLDQKPVSGAQNLWRRIRGVSPEQLAQKMAANQATGAAQPEQGQQPAASGTPEKPSMRERLIAFVQGLKPQAKAQKPADASATAQAAPAQPEAGSPTPPTPPAAGAATPPTPPANKTSRWKKWLLGTLAAGAVAVAFWSSLQHNHQPAATAPVAQQKDASRVSPRASELVAAQPAASVASDPSVGLDQSTLPKDLRIEGMNKTDTNPVLVPPKQQRALGPTPGSSSAQSPAAAASTTVVQPVVKPTATAAPAAQPVVKPTATAAPAAQPDASLSAKPAAKAPAAAASTTVVQPAAKSLAPAASTTIAVNTDAPLQTLLLSPAPDDAPVVTLAGDKATKSFSVEGSSVSGTVNTAKVKGKDVVTIVTRNSGTVNLLETGVVAQLQKQVGSVDTLVLTTQDGTLRTNFIQGDTPSASSTFTAAKGMESADTVKGLNASAQTVLDGRTQAAEAAAKAAKEKADREAAAEAEKQRLATIKADIQAVTDAQPVIASPRASEVVHLQENDPGLTTTTTVQPATATGSTAQPTAATPKTTTAPVVLTSTDKRFGAPEGGASQVNASATFDTERGFLTLNVPVAQGQTPEATMANLLGDTTTVAGVSDTLKALTDAETLVPKGSPVNSFAIQVGDGESAQTVRFAVKDGTVKKMIKAPTDAVDPALREIITRRDAHVDGAARAAVQPLTALANTTEPTSNVVVGRNGRSTANAAPFAVEIGSDGGNRTGYGVTVTGGTAVVHAEKTSLVDLAAMGALNHYAPTVVEAIAGDLGRLGQPVTTVQFTAKDGIASFDKETDGLWRRKKLGRGSPYVAGDQASIQQAQGLGQAATKVLAGRPMSDNWIMADADVRVDAPAKTNPTATIHFDAGKGATGEGATCKVDAPGKDSTVVKINCDKDTWASFVGQAGNPEQDAGRAFGIVQKALGSANVTFNHNATTQQAVNLAEAFRNAAGAISEIQITTLGNNKPIVLKRPAARQGAPAQQLAPAS